LNFLSAGIILDYNLLMNKPNEPILSLASEVPAKGHSLFSAIGSSLVIHEWKGAGPPYMHVHHEDDEAWHILEGTLIFHFRDRVIEAPTGSTVFVPAGVPHTYSVKVHARYLMILTPRLHALITALHKAPISEHASIMKVYGSEIL
jgi:mannose-6-phosphate isomerase-like protein (cupin superfamily)